MALIGITNTLSLAVYERTREIGLMRAIGTLRTQIRRMIFLESSIISIFINLFSEKKVSNLQNGYFLPFKLFNQDKDLNDFFLHAFDPNQGIKS